MSQHTSGPLRVVPCTSQKWATAEDCAIVDADGMIIGEAYNIVEAGITRPAEANARLWASAPDLLAFLTEYFGGRNECQCDICSRVKGLIAKATGQEVL